MDVHCPACWFEAEDGYGGEPCPGGDERIQTVIRWLHEVPECGVGGPLHLVTDDPNHDDGSLDYCLATMDEHWSVVGNEWAPEIIWLSTWIVDHLRPLTLHERWATCRGW